MSGKSTSTEKLVLQVVATAEAQGLSGINPVILSTRGNLIVHLAPHLVVARIAVVLPKEDAELAYQTADRELKVAHHLKAKRVPVVAPSSIIDAKPYVVGGAVLTFWDYVTPTHLQRPQPSDAFALVAALSTGMNSYVGELPALGVWDSTCRSADRLKDYSDHRLQHLLVIFREVDEQVRAQGELLVPSHGDAHFGNLMGSPQGWLWMDFEDVSLMPAYWDRASFVCNLALFRGLDEPTFRYFCEQATDYFAFKQAITARTLMSTLGNLDFALAGHGDLDYATRQLVVAGEFLGKIRGK